MSDPTVPTPFFNVRDFGATGDGTTDDTAALNRAITQASSPPEGNTVFFPAGNYRVTSSLVVPRGVALQGVGWNTPGAGGTFVGSWIFVSAGSNFSPVTLTAVTGSGGNPGNGSAVRALAFNVTGQSTTGAPAPAAAMILIDGSDALVEDVLLYNPYGGIDIHGVVNAGGDLVEVGRVVIRRVCGQPIQFGIKVDNSFDTVRIESVHFWTYWQPPGTPVADYQLANGSAISLYRADNPHISNVTVLHYSTGLSLSTSNSPPSTPGGNIPHKVHLVNADLDGCVTGIHVYSPGTSEDYAHLQMSNVTIQAPTAGAGVPTGNGIWIEAGSPYVLVQASNLRITNSGQSAVRIDAGNAKFDGENVYIEEWLGTYGFYIPAASSYAWLGVGFGHRSSAGATPYYPPEQFHLAQSS